MNVLLERLGAKERRGSKPRCHFLTHGPAPDVAARLTALAAPWVQVSPDDHWMPEGFDNTAEAELHKAARLLPDQLRNELTKWWLPQGRQEARTPNFDITSTCTIDGIPGLLLVEAKAYDEELHKATAGRRLSPDASEDSRASHRTITAAIESARRGLCTSTQLSWQLSVASHYQMTNRLAWAWKLASLGVPVVLVYLGFLNASEMTDQGQPFSSPQEWEALVRKHSAQLFPDKVWNKRWMIDRLPMNPLINSVEQAIDGESD